MVINYIRLLQCREFSIESRLLIFIRSMEILQQVVTVYNAIYDIHLSNELNKDRIAL